MRNEFLYFCFLFSSLIGNSFGAVAAPPWSDPKNNPCANQPAGWQLIYWPPLKKCFKIFQLGYPCPESMELSPVGAGITGQGSTAECRCPPGTAQSPINTKCYKLFEREPCDFGQYFSPIPDPPRKSAIPKQRWGICKSLETTCGQGMVYWPQNGKCYHLQTKGPCSKGKLLTIDNEKIPRCRCEKVGDLSPFYHPETQTCHEYFTKGPCQRSGELFLPSKKCGCHQKIPHFYNQTNQCYEIKSQGPCALGHEFVIADLSQDSVKAECRCKEGYVNYKDGYCYRQHTRGPCPEGSFITVSSTCIKNPCDKGRLYFPKEKTCYRLGSQGPCALNQVVVFDFTTRPSIDGISFNGVCGCAGIISNLDQTCMEDDGQPKSACDSAPGMVEVKGECYKLYSRGPCGPGQWLEPKKLPERPKTAKCMCKPGYTPYDNNEHEFGVIGCHAPAVSIARFLNGKNHKNYKFGFQRFVSILDLNS